MDSEVSIQFKIILGSSSIARKKILSEMGYQFTTMSADIDEKAIRKEKPEDLVMALAEAKADAVASKLQNIENQENDGKPTLLVAADTAEAIMPKLHIGEYNEDAEPTRLQSQSLCLFLQLSSVKDSNECWAEPAVGKLFVLRTGDFQNGLEVVVYQGMIREKPSNKEEARQFIKGYSSGHATTVSSVVVTNLKTGFRRGEWDKVEIQFHDIPEHIIDNLIEEGNVLNVAGGLIIEHPLVLPYVKAVVGTMDSVMGLPKALTERLIKEVL
ncbi:Maf-like protein [Forsythia ovata]|uniref:Maf-like protein n=1 Tax=Forsythia ovata TaxID=205694 RepID=A0ABD1VLV6_9LAMI